MDVAMTMNQGVGSDYAPPPHWDWRGRRPLLAKMAPLLLPFGPPRPTGTLSRDGSISRVANAKAYSGQTG